MSDFLKEHAQCSSTWKEAHWTSLQDVRWRTSSCLRSSIGGCAQNSSLAVMLMSSTNSTICLPTGGPYLHQVNVFQKERYSQKTSIVPTPDRFHTCTRTIYTPTCELQLAVQHVSEHTVMLADLLQTCVKKKHSCMHGMEYYTCRSRQADTAAWSSCLFLWRRSSVASILSWVAMLVVWALKVSVDDSIAPDRLCCCSKCCMTADLPTPLLPAPA